MDMQARLQRIQHIEYLINSKTANSLKKLSAKLNISQRQIKNYIRIMRDLGAPIDYDRRVKKYYFTENKHFIFGFR